MIQGMSGGQEDNNKDLVLINQGLQSEIKKLQEQLLEEKNIRKRELGRMRKDNEDKEKEYKSQKDQSYFKDKEIEKAKINNIKKQDEATARLQKLEQEMEMEK